MDPLTAARIQTVRDHMRLECEGDWDGIIAAFAHPALRDLRGRHRSTASEPCAATSQPRGFRFPTRPTRSSPLARGRFRAGRVLADGNTTRAVADTEGRNRADRQDVPRPDDGKFRIRTRHGQHYLRAPLLRPPRGGHGTWNWLTERAAYFRYTDPTYELLASGGEQRASSAVRLMSNGINIQYGLRSRASTWKALVFSSLM